MEEKQELIQAYLTLADEKLEVARELFDTSHYDDAVSRAYYVMFYAAKAVLLAVGSDPRSHSGVVNQFGQHVVKTGYAERRYSRMLTKAMQSREASDYDPITRSLLAEAEQTITDAEVFLKKIREILSKLPGEDV